MVAIDNSGDRIAIGSYFTSTNGSIRVFEYSENEWFQIGQTIHGSSENNYDSNIGKTIEISGKETKLFFLMMSLIMDMDK